MTVLSLSIKMPDTPPEGAADWDATLGPWADCEANAEEAVNRAVADYFDDETWDEWFGLNESDTRVEVMVTTPPSVAGSYEVRLERVTKASSRRLPPIEDET